MILLLHFQIMRNNQTSDCESTLERQWVDDAAGQLQLAHLAASEAKRHINSINNPPTSSTRSVFLQDIDITVALAKTTSRLLAPLEDQIALAL